MLHSRLATLLFVFCLLAGCALSPQTVTVNPRIDLAELNQEGSPTRIMLKVVDERGTSIVGTRGGVYPETSRITTSDDIKAPIRNVLAKSLQNIGYEVVADNRKADAEFRVIVDSLDYQATDKKVMKAVETSATIRVVLTKANSEYTGRYRGQRTTEVLKAPDEKENAEMINAALSRVLQRALNDPELHQFLRD